jgi:hypothetical protein
VIAQEADLSGEGASSESDLIKPNIGPAVGKSVCDFINAECDYIGQTLIRAKVEKSRPMADGPEIEIKTGKSEYCLRVAPNEVYQAGFRIPLGKELKEDFIVNPSYEKIVKLIEGK